MEPGFAWSARLHLPAEDDKPLCEVRAIRRAARRIVRMSGHSMAAADLLPALRVTRYYGDGSPEARDAFFLACIRADPQAIIEGPLVRLPPLPRVRSQCAPMPH